MRFTVSVGGGEVREDPDWDAAPWLQSKHVNPKGKYFASDNNGAGALIYLLNSVYYCLLSLIFTLGHGELLMFSLKGNLGDHFLVCSFTSTSNSLALKRGHTEAHRVLNFESHSQAFDDKRPNLLQLKTVASITQDQFIFRCGPQFHSLLQWQSWTRHQVLPHSALGYHSITPSSVGYCLGVISCVSGSSVDS